MEKTYKRRLINFLIYPKFQLSLVGVQTLMMMLAFGFAQWENGLALARLRQLGVESSLSGSHPYFRFIDMASHSFFLHTLGAFGIALTSSCAVTLYFSFKLAGPISRLKGYMNEVSMSGVRNAGSLKFRKGDFYGDLPFFVNKAIISITEDKKEKKDMLRKVA